LEGRYAESADRLHTLQREKPDSGQRAGEELEAMADDLTAAIEDLIRDLDTSSGRRDRADGDTA
jgi:hypothetical protein